MSSYIIVFENQIKKKKTFRLHLDGRNWEGFQNQNNKSTQLVCLCLLLTNNSDLRKHNKEQTCT